MITIEIKQKLHKFLRLFYEMAKVYLEQSERDQMIMEGEEDIKAGRTFSLKETKRMINN